MTQSSVSIKNAEILDFVNLFVSTKKESSETNIHERYNHTLSKNNALLNWFNNTETVIPVELKIISAGNIFQSDRYILKFELSDHYKNNFVLLRGLLEFSRPKKIVITSDAVEKTFEVHFAQDQTSIILSYLDTMLLWLKKELNFKSTLKTIIRFEDTIRLEQQKLYEVLKATIH